MIEIYAAARADPAQCELAGGGRLMARSDRRVYRNHNNLDETDFFLLSIVQEDCTKTAVEISKALREKAKEAGDENLAIGSAACGQRMNALNESGHIKKNCSILDPEKFGLHQLCFMLVKMHSQDAESLEDFLSVAMAEDTIQDIYEMTGICDYLLKVRVVNIAEATKLSQKLSRTIADIQTYPAGGTLKETTAIRLRPAR